jgi:hypothetical protein
LLYIGIIEYERWCMPAQFKRDSLKLLAGNSAHMSTGGDRTGEGRFADDGRSDEIFGNLRRLPEDDVHYAFRNSSLFANLAKRDGGSWRFFGRLQDQRATSRERMGDLAARHHARKVPGRECRDRTDRFVDHQGARIGKPAGHDASVHAAAFLGEPFHELGGREYLCARFRKRLTLLERRDSGKCVRLLAQER